MKKLVEAIVNGDIDLTSEITKEMINSGIEKQYLLGIFSEAARQVSKISEKETLIHELLAIAAIEQSFNIFVNDIKNKNPTNIKNVSIIIGTIFGEYHDLGKNMLSHLLKTLGYRVIDLGRSVSIETFISQAKKNDVDIIAVSASMSHTKIHVKTLAEHIINNKIKAKLIIGGGIIDKAFADSLSANYSPGPFAAIEKIDEIMTLSK